MTNTSDDDGPLCWAQIWLAAEHDIVHVPIASLRPGESPRLKGESKGHTTQMVQAGVAAPIIVYRPTMDVIDGRHRLKAAVLRGQDAIAVLFFDGTVDQAFVLSVAANIAHGLPLTIKERKAAAERFLGMYPDCSDRAIAESAGLSHRTVARIRRKWSTGQIVQLTRRRGKDGKSRPLTSDDGRRAVAELIRTNQGKSEREIAREANVSRGTVRDVRDRLARGVSPVVSMTPRGSALGVHLARGQAVLTRLRNNPSVRSTDSGKALLRLLSLGLRVVSDAQAASRAAPEHCRESIADLAAALSDAWSRLAKDLRTKPKAG